MIKSSRRVFPLMALATALLASLHLQAQAAVPAGYAVSYKYTGALLTDQLVTPYVSSQVLYSGPVTDRPLVPITAEFIFDDYLLDGQRANLGAPTSADPQLLVARIDASPNETVYWAYFGGFSNPERVSASGSLLTDAGGQIIGWNFWAQYGGQGGRVRSRSVAGPGIQAIDQTYGNDFQYEVTRTNTNLPGTWAISLVAAPFALDPQAPVKSIPEPQTYAMALAGLSVAAVMMRRARSTRQRPGQTTA